MLTFIRRGVIVILFLLAAFYGIPRIIAPLIERLLNRVRLRPPYQVQEETRTLHKQLFIVDLHADPLLWKRDLLQRSRYGHVDFPRLAEGNVSLQVFAAATKIPVTINFESNPARSDLLVPLTLIQAWPRRTWYSLLQRALYQAEKLQEFISQDPDRLLLIKNRNNLDQLLAGRESEQPLIGALLALEGVHALEGDIANLDVLYYKGFRMIGLAHFIDNEAGGSAHGRQKGGLTPFGREIVLQVEQKRMVLDLAHASAQLIDDVLNLATAPLIVSHTGVRGVCDSPRNISDDHVRGIAATGGLIGIALFEETVCGTTIDDTARTMRYVADLVGVDHVALGSDYDGAITAPMDTSGMVLLTEALLTQDFTADETAKIMGGNALSVLQSILPDQD